MTEKSNQPDVATGIPHTITAISEIKNDISNVELVGKILSLHSKEFSKDGRKMIRYFGMIGDPSGTIGYSAWRELGVGKNDVVRISNAKVRQWQDVVSINIGAKTKVQRITDKSILDNFEERSAPRPVRKLFFNQFRPGLNNISCICRIISIEPLGLQIDGELKTVFKGVAADKTGSVRFTAWEDFGLKPDKVIDVQNASINIWNNYLELGINRQTRICEKPDDLIPPISLSDIVQQMSISTLFEKEYLTAPEFYIKGKLLDFKAGSGLIYRCRDCKRALIKGDCPIHGSSGIEYDLRLKAVLDDGTGAVTVFIDKNLTEQLTGKTLKACIESNSSGNNIESINSEIRGSILLKELKVQGNVIRDEFGLSIFAHSIELVDINEHEIHTRAQKLLNEME